MKLSARLLVYHLKKKFFLRASSTLNAEPELLYPVCYSPGEPLIDGRVYLIDDPDFSLPSHRLTNLLLIFVGSGFSVSEQDYPNLCLLPETVRLAEALETVQAIFALYEQWNQSLIDSRLQNASIQNLLDLTEVIIPNPMMLIGMDFTIIAYKHLDFQELKSPVLGSSEETRGLVDRLKSDPNYEDAFYKEGYFFYPGNEVCAPALCVNITSNQRAVYRLMYMEGEAPMDETFGFLLEYLARMINQALYTRTAPNHDTSYPLHRIFTAILTDPGADYVEISQQLSAIGWPSSHSYLCILILTGLMDQKNLTLHSICRYVENTIPQSCAVEHRENAVVYIDLDLCGMTIAEISGRLDGFLQSSLLSAGYSRRMLGHFNFRRQYVQASVALEMGSRKNPALSSHQFNDIALPYLLKQMTRKLPAYMVCHEKLLALKYEDEAKNSQLYETLRCFLTNHQSIAHTAEALYIHRTTLLYRLDKIKARLGTDFSDPDELLYLLLSFRLMDLEDEKHL